MIGDEFNTIVMQGEFSEALELLIENEDNTVFTFGDYPMLFNDEMMGVFNKLPIHGIVKQGWKRSEVDGVLTTKLPREATTFTISKDSLPIFVLNDDRLSTLKFNYRNTLWKVVYVIGIDLLSFMVTVDDDLLTDDTEEEENLDEIEEVNDEFSDDDIPGLV